MAVRPMHVPSSRTPRRVGPVVASTRLRLFSTTALRRAQEALKSQDARKTGWQLPHPLRLQGQAIVTGDPSKPRRNPVGIQLLSESFHRQIFPGSSGKAPDSVAVQTSIQHLHSHELLNTPPPDQPPIDFPLPPLHGKNIDEHFHNMGIHEAEPYLSMAETFAATAPVDLPEKFSHASGWTRYDPVTGEQTAVPYPDESMLTFDVEVLYKINPYPIMAAAMSSTHWYTWLSPWLLGESEQEEHLVPLGPPEEERIVVGHNVGYDRIRIKEEYALTGSKNRFLDTMSFHSASQGVSAPQRGQWLLHKKNQREAERHRKERLEALETEAESLKQRIADGETEETVDRTVDVVAADDGDYMEGLMFPEVLQETKTVSITRRLDARLREVEAEIVDLPMPSALEVGKRYVSRDTFGPKPDGELDHDIEDASDEAVAAADRSFRIWEDLTATSSLEEVFKLHFPTEQINKTTRNAFAAEDRSFILEDLQNLIHYCASDVHATHRVYSRTLPRYRRLCPSPASFAGMLVMGSAFLPINNSWDKYMKSSEEKYVELDMGVREKLASLAETAREEWTQPPPDFKLNKKDPDEVAHYACPDKFRNDPYMSQLDWTPKKAKHFQWAKKDMSPDGAAAGGAQAKSGGVLPKSPSELASSKVIPGIIGLTFRNSPVDWSVEHGWIYKRDPTDPAAAAHEPASDAISFNDERDSYLSSQVVERPDRKMRTTFHRLPNPAKSSKLTRCLGKQFLQKSGHELSCHDDRLLQMIIDEAEWSAIENRLRDHLKGTGALSGLQATEPADAADTPEASSLTPPPPEVAPAPRPQLTLPESFDALSKDKAIPSAIGLRFDGNPIEHSAEHGWICLHDTADPDAVAPDSPPVAFSKPADAHLSQSTSATSTSAHQLPVVGKATKVTRCLGGSFLKKHGGRLSCANDELMELLVASASKDEQSWRRALELLEEVLTERGYVGAEATPAASTVEAESTAADIESAAPTPAEDVPRDYLTASPSARAAEWWPTWYADLFTPSPTRARDQMNLSVRNTVATLLLRLSWRAFPLFKSRQFGWVFRMPLAEAEIENPDRDRWLKFDEGEKALQAAEDEAAAVAAGEAKAAAPKKPNPDVALHRASRAGEFVFFQVPHPNGEGNNVGYMTSKPFIKFIEDDTLSSVYPLAKDAMMMNVACSYWISVRERVVEQLPIRQSSAMPMGFPADADNAAAKTTAGDATESKALAGSSLAVGVPDNDKGYGIILPQVVVMGTITRRAIEKTWLTASNAKANRVGSELKAMVQAPEGYCIVGADVDSEELWIASLLGDAQLGMHGASAIGWMTLEGTKGAGTDVHSKTASIVNITRDQAKVFNYSRIYGAGVKNATRLLLDGMADPDPAEAEARAKKLYLSTKGDRFKQKCKDFHPFWHGGTESFLFNSIEQVARSRRPTTPALGCGVTAALREEFLTNKDDHMTSRINWVVQSSGVDYLHLLIVAVNRLCALYAIDARYLLSVHDEVRYLVRERDRYRLALALQVANLWTRSLFAFKLGMDDLPQGCAFFSEVDVDRVLRKEVGMPCVTPSNPHPIPPGEALGIGQVLERTHGGSLFADGARRRSDELELPPLPAPPPGKEHLYPPRPYRDPSASPSEASSAPPASRTAAASQQQQQRAAADTLGWRRFFLQAQALAAEADVYAAWAHYGKPPDPIKARGRRDGRAPRRWEDFGPKAKASTTTTTAATSASPASGAGSIKGAKGAPPPMVYPSGA